MGDFFIFTIKVSLCLVAFYLIHKFLFSNDKLHAFNRVLLLLVIVLSLVLPFIKVSTLQSNIINDGMLQIEDFILSAEISDSEETLQFSIVGCACIIYVLGVVAFLVREIWGMFRLREIIRSGIIKEIREGAKVVVVDRDIAPFSWFGYVVISEKDYRENPQEIITHEIAHINYCHSIDVALCNLLIIFQWYNPAAWLIRRELQDVHEFEADEKVLEKGVDAKQYQMLLIKKSVGEHMFSMANNLNHNSLKKRIKMMKTEKTNRWHCIKAFALVPIVAIAVIAFANPKVEAMAIKAKAEGDAIFNALVPNDGTVKEESSAIVDDENSSEQVQLTAAAQPEEKGNYYSVVDEMPIFPGGMSKLIQYLQENIKYPAEAMTQGVQGRVITRFVVKTDGSIEDVKIVKSVDAQLDAEALRVVGAMPKWTPGKHDGKLVNVQYTLPIDFRLNKPSGAIEEGNVEKLKIVSDDKPVVIASDSKKVVYYIDGKKAAEGVVNLNPDDIENITVLKGKAAAEKLGNSDCDGVIMIKIKKNK